MSLAKGAAGAVSVILTVAGIDRLDASTASNVQPISCFVAHGPVERVDDVLGGDR